MQQDNSSSRRRSTWDWLPLADISSPASFGDDRRPNEVQLLLLEAVSTLEFDGALASRIRQLVSDGADVNYQYGEDRLSALHILCHHRMSVPEWQTLWLAAFHSLLAMGADVSLEDAEGNTPLLTAVSCRCPVAAITHLVDMTTVNVNKTNMRQNTGLHILLSKEGVIDREILRSLVRAGADVTAVGEDGQTPLQLILGRPETDCMQLLDLVQQYEEIGAMLSFMMVHGTAAQVQVLLRQCYRCGDKVEAELIVTAAGADCDPWEKIEMLVDSGVGIDTVCPITGENILHRAATSSNLLVLKNSSEKGVPHIADSNGDFPIHKAASSASTVDCLIELLSQQDSLKNATNKANETPLSLTVRIGSRDKVISLLNSGCMPNKSKLLKHVSYEELSMLADPHVIAQSPHPLMFCLQMVKIFKKASLLQDTYYGECCDTADEMLTLAIDLVDGSKEFPEDVVINYALDQRLKKFIACTTIQQQVAQSWYGTGHASGFRKVKFTQEVIFYLLLFPIFPIRFLFGMKEHQVKLCIQYTAYIVSYFTLYVLLVATIVWNNSHSRCDNPSKGTGCRLSAFDWTVFVFVIGLDAQDWFHVTMNTLFNSRFSSLDSLMQYLSNLLLNVYYILSFIGFYADLSTSVRVWIIHISYYIISVVVVACSFRFLQLLESNAFFGTILVSFKNMLKMTAGYFIFLVSQLVTTACAISGIYAAEVKRPGAGVVGNSTANLPGASRFTSSLRYLYFSLFGLTDLDAFTSGSDDIERSLEDNIAIFMFGVWLTMIFIFYFSMLIAHVTNAYQAVEDNSQIERKFTKAVIVRQMKNSPLRPVPLNLLYHIIKFITCRCRTCRTSFKVHGSEGQDMAVTESASQRRMMRYFLEKSATREAERPAEKKDLIAVYDELDNLKNCTTFVPSAVQCQSSGSDVNTVLLKLDASVARLVETVDRMETRLAWIERKFDNTMV